MAMFSVSYTVAGRPNGRELIIEREWGTPTLDAVARAILEREFAEVDAPFGPGNTRTASQALQRFSVANVELREVKDG
jgi:hypothetical protein